MLSYLHQFHAGNHADVLKHWLLQECIAYMQQKDTGIDFIDTHAGAGIYHLGSAQAAQTGEAHNGILRLLKQPQAAETLPEFCRFVEPYVTRGRYPGSPEWVRAHLRPQDRSWLFELHPTTFTKLQGFVEDKWIFVRNDDGLKQLTGLLPPPSKRALVIIDPSFEVKQEFETVAQVLSGAWKRFPQGTFLLWYPILQQQRHLHLKKRIQQAGVRNILCTELAVGASAPGMQASGVLLVNPPWSLAAKVKTALSDLSALLSEDGTPRCSCDMLVGQ